MKDCEKEYQEHKECEDTLDPYATPADVIALFRPMKDERELSRVRALLPIISDRLRYEASQVGMNLDREIRHTPGLASVARSVVVDIVARTLMTPTSAGDYGPMSQISQSAGGYSASGTLLNPGGGVFIKDSELAALGIRRQRYGAIEIYANPRNPHYPI